MLKALFVLVAAVIIQSNQASAAPILCPDPATIDRRCDIWDDVCGFPNEEPIYETLLCFDKKQVDPRCRFELNPCPRPAPARR